MAFPPLSPLSPLLIVQVGTPPDVIRHPFGDLPDWYCRALQRPRDSVTVVRVFEGEALPPPDASRVAIITGSWSMVTDLHPWSEATAQWIRDAMEVQMPLFGVCYGHQLMAHALGGRVDYHALGREVGCRTIRLLPEAESDALLEGWPSTFPAHLTHEQSVIELPPGARVLAYSDHDPHQIVRYGPNAVSTQFHPEFTPEISAACINRSVDLLRGEGKDPEAMLRALEETHEATRLLRRFVDSFCYAPS
ncbi:glutamine amidotransferase [Paraburkholderia sp.]|uniref:glutamine amidotransferase n=1 Tax=Paraburkholderia sp. TaxID=1926495 RepID=UPI0025FA2BA6|nr:glutamine amidotransferase [Paraburkholderia sp.]